MEFEEIVKRVEWLDEQQRKAKADTNDRWNPLNTSVNTLMQQVKSLNQQMNDLSLAAARLEQFDQIMAKHRTDLTKIVETIEKNTIRREQENIKLHHTEMEETRKTVLEMRNTLSVEEIAKRDRAHEEQRRSIVLQDMRGAVDTILLQIKELQEAQKNQDDIHRADSKRVADLQAEMTANRKRAEDAREKITLHSDSIRNMENRINELITTEASRHERHSALLQEQALAQVERDRAWKEWQEKYGSFQQQAANAERQVATFEEAIRGALRAQEAYEGLNQRLERRIAEVGEIQRLAEERIRQEWVAFKAEEQKRWAGHSLSQDESMRDLGRDVDKMEKRLTALDEAAQTMQDQLQQTTDTTEKQLQELMNLSQEWLSAYERIMGHTKTKAKKSTR
jgi:chromosome segregation ATPase